MFLAKAGGVRRVLSRRRIKKSKLKMKTPRLGSKTITDDFCKFWKMIVWRPHFREVEENKW